MVSFSLHSLGTLIHVEGTLNRFGYESILGDYVHPNMLIVFPGADGIFQQHSVRCDTARNDRHWLEEHDLDFQVLPRPLNPPDLTPTEHLWDNLDCRVRDMDPHRHILCS